MTFHWTFAHDYAQEIEASAQPYYLGLLSLALYNCGQPQRARQLATRLHAVQAADGRVAAAASRTWCLSGGIALQCEVTSVAILCWLRTAGVAGGGDAEARAAATRGMEWFLMHSRGGAFGSTQSTWWALTAIVTYFEAEPDRLPPHGTDSTVSVHVDGEHAGDVSVRPSATSTLPVFGERLAPGDHRIELSVAKGGASFLPFTLSVRYNTSAPQPQPGAAVCAVSLEVVLARSALTEGEGTDVRVTLTNTTLRTLPMVCVIVGVPGGLVIQTDPLDELLVTVESLSAYEIHGRELILYLAGMHAGDGSALELPIEVLAIVPGHFTGPASRAYLYYTHEIKSWAAPLAVEIAVDDGSSVLVGS